MQDPPHYRRLYIDMNNNLLKILAVSLVVIAILIGWSLYVFNNSSREPTLTTQPKTTDTLPSNDGKILLDYSTPLQIGDTNLLVELADSQQKQTLGLSNRPLLENTQGMLFDFQNTKTTRPTFWMKDMLFDLDIIWIENLTVVEITKNVPAPNDNTPDAKLIRYTPQVNANMVLEVRSGWSEENKIKVGDKISF